MFDKTIKIEINGVRHTLTNEEVKTMAMQFRDYKERAELAEAKRDDFNHRLAFAISKLRELGYVGDL